MRDPRAAAVLILGLVAAGGACAEDETAFCDALRSQNVVTSFTPSGNLYYRDAAGGIIALGRSDTVPKAGIQTLYYYLRADPGLLGKRSVLNIKFVYRSEKPPSRQQIVDLRNDRWNGYTYRHAKRVKNDCAGLNVDGYERFHLNNSRNYCLSTHFHQYHPDFETLATVERRTAFAFQDMIGDRPADLISSLFGLFAPGAAVAAPGDQVSTAKLSYVRSWIRNFDYNGKSERCIAIDPDFPENVASVHLRIVNFGTDLNFAPSSRNWQLTFTP